MEFKTTSFDIHVFGDSHSRIYSSPYLAGYVCKVYYVGAITMHRIGRDQPTLKGLQNLSKEWYKEYTLKAKPVYKHMKYPEKDEIKPNDVVVFVFGEIDIRNHFYKQIQKGRNHEEVLSVLANNYVDHVHNLQNNHPNVRFYIQSIMPPSAEENIKEQTKDYPVEGPFENRLFANKYINEYIQNKCKHYNIGFIDVTSYYQNDNGPFPVYGVDVQCEIGEMDTRIKDESVHVSMQHPDGVALALQAAGIDPNISIYKYKRKCKYPIPLNEYQRNFAIRLRWLHIVLGTFLIISLFLPTILAPYVFAMWLYTLVLNLFLGNGTCFLTILEFRNSNCNDRTFYDELGIPRTYQIVFSVILYTIAIVILPIRLYYYYKNK